MACKVRRILSFNVRVVLPLIHVSMATCACICVRVRVCGRVQMSLLVVIFVFPSRSPSTLDNLRPTDLRDETQRHPLQLDISPMACKVWRISSFNACDVLALVHVSMAAYACICVCVHACGRVQMLLFVAIFVSPSRRRHNVKTQRCAG